MTAPAPVPAGCCAVCRLTEEGLGFSPPNGRKKNEPLSVTWTCRDHIDLARTVHNMPREALSTLESQALRDGGDLAGAYLDEIGKTDLAALTEEEWVRFLCRVLDGYGASLSEQLQAHKAPF